VSPFFLYLKPWIGANFSFLIFKISPISPFILGEMPSILLAYSTLGATARFLLCFLMAKMYTKKLD
jgi:hypothetical protein